MDKVLAGPNERLAPKVPKAVVPGAPGFKRYYQEKYFKHGSMKVDLGP